MNNFQNERLIETFDSLPGYHKDGHPWARKYIGWAAPRTYSEGSGWEEPQTWETWEDFRSSWNSVDPDLNLVADFYFDLTYDRETCDACKGSGYNQETHEIYENFYALPEYLGNEFGEERWCDDITEDELRALKDENRIPDEATVSEVNKANTSGSGYHFLYSHDAINRGILIEARAKRRGVWGNCPTCDRKGAVRTGPDRLALHLWMLHPRKMASRGILIRHVDPDVLEEVKAFLQGSWENHNRHFKWVEE